MLLELLKRVITALEEKEIAYMLSGSIAMNTYAYGFPVWIVSVEDLIIAKINWIQELQSEMQMRDIQNLLEDNQVDMAYIRHWLKQMNLKTFDLL